MTVARDETADRTSRGERPGDAVVGSIRGIYDALTVKRVFGDAYESNGVTVIPVARIGGGAGGGGGEGTSDAEAGGGFGTGFGLGARPVGVYCIDGEGRVAWKPAVDATRVVRGAQVLSGIVAVCITLVLLARR
ncbi:MAG: hypothetical protein MUE78_00985 [Ilumatobacteraceae bacterium]|jgi:uncharacterized spore protein YtfJ|nr:hypothetical protein [Ilumatobacteraceae bacterium]